MFVLDVSAEAAYGSAVEIRAIAGVAVVVRFNPTCTYKWIRTDGAQSHWEAHYIQHIGAECSVRIANGF